MSVGQSENTKMVGVDVGGTFTDVVALDELGAIVPAKVPTDVQSSDRSVLKGAAEIGVGDASVFNLASTAGINAVITRRLPKIGLLTTLGHRDVLDRGSLARPVEALTNPAWQRSFSDDSRPLVPRYLRRGVRERIRATGDVLVPLDETQTRTELRVLEKSGVEGVAIVLLNAYLNPTHELRLREIVREELGDLPCSISSDVSPTAKEFWRAATTVVDVVMKLIYEAYTLRMGTGLASLDFKGTFNYADCRATLMPASYAMQQPYRLVVGGPAGGTVACAHFGSLIDDDRLICADVGGTSVDISVVNGGKPWVNTTFELEFDLIVNALSIDVITLGAGGGSIVGISPSGDVIVGPASAGAHPGPACYGDGGTNPTVTDTALLMGILDADGFLGGQIRLSESDALAAFEALDTPLSLGDRLRYAWETCLNNIAEGIFDIAVRRGIDSRDFSLVAYGAAGPMLLPALLDLVPLRRVIVPPHPGLFSAVGLLSADQVYSDQRSAYTYLVPDAASTISEIYQRMEDDLLRRTGFDRGSVQIVRAFDGRLAGQGWETPFVPVPSGEITPQGIEEMVANFHSAYEERWGHRFPQFPVEGVTYRVEIIVPSPKVRFQPLATSDEAPRARRQTTLRHIYAAETAADEYQRGDLLAGQRIEGPAVVREAMSTTFVPAGRSLTVGSLGELVVQ